MGLLLSSPHNPTGVIISLEQLTAIANAAQKHGVKVINDRITVSAFPRQGIETIFCFQSWEVKANYVSDR
ncbi:aminotransferase class I/II-fold pyridoxal phosphate-dependent enzyme [Nostoc sp. CHAB 5844]|nr:aminotransferase class I/II-fold pyridoxal phosphate-dependent enzyme [Nostoc sp. CHAB 5844]